MELRSIPIHRLKPAPYNPRVDLTPDDLANGQLKHCMDLYGYVVPIVWNKRTGRVVAGHQRLKVLAAQGRKEVEVVVVDLSPAQEKALNLALNKIDGKWDYDKLARLLDELVRLPEFDLATTGFEPSEVDELLAQFLPSDTPQGEDALDVGAELQAQRPPVTRPGDLILLGRDARLQHRLLCGDCTDPGHVQRLMNGLRAQLFATDPPYLVGFTGTNHPGINPAKKNKDWSDTYAVDWDDAAANPDLYAKFLRTAVGHAIAADAPCYLWHASRRQAMLEGELVEAGFLVHAQIIWVKPRPVLTRSWFLWGHEPCFMGWLKGHRPRPRGPGLGRSKEPMRSTVWQVDGIGNGPERPDHPTPKPLELFAIPMRQHTVPGEICYEPFAGSGTQIIAAQQCRRRCFAIEISPTYCDLIVRRFIALAGESAVEPAVAKKYRLSEKEVAA